MTTDSRPAEVVVEVNKDKVEGFLALMKTHSFKVIRK